ncbi:hypothetical protein GCM10023185_28710 [Hymenobacter saemangeumensis]|uniref:Uncharacterized protein n=1 Tax=Hymenobacter saemangeumensis TaxID=1084522 RepID=A0ABP8IKK1_9BACT
MAGRKKIRGFSRHLRRHQRWARQLSTPDFSHLAAYHYDHQKLGLNLWFGHEKPPLVIRRVWVAYLLALHSYWQQELQARHPQHYLAIWLFEPDFGHSQLVAGVGERLDYYENTFARANQPLPLPATYASLPGAADLEWTCQVHLEGFDPEDFKNSRRLSAKKHKLYQAPGCEEMVLVELGHVWVGRAR